MSFTAHKMYGPKGVGALYIRRRPPGVRLEPQITGGGQEGGVRGGTLNVPGIVGFAKALEISLAERDEEQSRLAQMRDRLYAGLCAAIDGVSLNGPALSEPASAASMEGNLSDRTPRRLAGNLNVTFGDVDGEALMMSIKDLAVSSGAACTSANPEPSHVLQALGLSAEQARSSLRFGLGRFNTEEEVDFAIEAVTGAVGRLRAMAGG